MAPNHFRVVPKSIRAAPKSFRAAPKDFGVASKNSGMAPKYLGALRCRPVAPPAQQGGEPGDHLGGGPFFVAGALEEDEGGGRLAKDRPRLEGGHELGREALQLLGVGPAHGMVSHATY